ncbi:MAG: TonB family protein [Pseudomonadota bacterium]
MSTASAEVFDVPVPPRLPGLSPPAPTVEVCAIYRGVMTHARILSFERPTDRRARGRQFTIGSEACVDAPVAEAFLPWGSHPLVMAAGDDYVVNVTPRMTGTVDDKGRVLPLAEYVRRKGTCFPLPATGSTEVDCGAIKFIVARVSPPRVLPPAAFRWNWGEQIYNLGSVLALLALVLVMAFVPADPRSLSLDLFGPGSRFLPFVVKPPEHDEAPPPWLTARPSPSSGQAGAREKGPAGAMGDRTSTKSHARHAIAGPKDNVDPRLAKDRAEETAKNAGVLGVLRAVQGSHITSIFGRTTALGNEAENLLGDLASNQLGNAYGLGGLGVTGSGAAAAGAGEGVIGIGNLVTIGAGTRGDGGNGFDRGVGTLRGRRRALVPDIIPSQASVRGALDKEIVRRVIRLHLNEVKYCYERELSKRPTLGGRVVVQFAISATGQVITSALQSSTMGNASVENCTVQAVRRWPFPKPSGGGLVQVSYPFVLTPAGT